MKRVVVIIASERPAHASGFVKAYERFGAKPDAFLYIRPGRSRSSALKAMLRPLKTLRPSEWKRRLVDLFRFLTNTQRLSTLKATWNVPKGENSWDLLAPGMDLIAYSRSHGIPVHTTSALDAAAIERLCAQGPTVFVLYAGGVLPEKVLKVPGAEFVNAHMGAMPRYRGMNAIEWAVLEGTVPKVSVMLMTSAIDGGDVIHEQEIPIGDARSIADLRRTGFEHCYLGMAEGVLNYAQGRGLRVPQGRGARYCYRMHGTMRRRLEAILATGPRS